jgi:hypothetical protein
MWRRLPRVGRRIGAVAVKMSDYRDIMRAQPPSVVLRAFAFETLGDLHADALEVLARLQGRVNMAVLTCDDNVWFLMSIVLVWLLQKR